MSETAVALRELLESAREVIDTPTAYLIGQLAAELIASAPDAELSGLVVAIHDSQPSSSSDRQAAPTPRQSVLSMVSGLLQGVLADRQSAAPIGSALPVGARMSLVGGVPADQPAAERTGSPATVRERVLNLLAIEPRNPTSLSTEIGCSIATASRALRGLRENGLVESGTDSDFDLADRRYVMYQLSDKGEKRQADRFFGQLKDEDDAMSEAEKADEGEGYDYGQLLAPLTHLAAELNKHDPAIAAELYPTLDALKDQVDDPKLRAAAVSELRMLARTNPDLGSAE
ncbi:hypothetical protein [Mycobacterium sp.]|uniref:hypothetical protein n=1 Tax=Mycobacterium sp. TaxID=1785 RepID=UPI003D6C2252